MVDIDGATTATIATGDKVNFLDITDSLVKEDTVQGILDLAGGGFTLATEQATTSGTSVTFGSIPAGTTMIVIMFESVSFSGESNLDVTIGDAGGLETSGYISVGGEIDAGPLFVNSTTEFIIDVSGSDSDLQGQMTLMLKDSSNFTWVASHNCRADDSVTQIGAGSKSLTAELTQVSISGDTFNAGSINIMYQ